jgi:hypothetical protein
MAFFLIIATEPVLFSREDCLTYCKDGPIIAAITPAANRTESLAVVRASVLGETVAAPANFAWSR